jgi:hypothetical protein
MPIPLEAFWTIGSATGLATGAFSGLRRYQRYRLSLKVNRAIAAYDEDVRRLAEHRASVDEQSA